MKVISLFAGIGGFDKAADWIGWEVIAHCEWNKFGQLVLKKHWPNAITYDDITKTDFSILRGRIDILTGGFPCQPYSVAGKRKGKEDERHLWTEMLRAIREIQPRWVVGENVRGIINWNGGLVFDEVQADLEAEGYKILPFLLPAAGVNAPHERYRTWFVAYSDCIGSGRGTIIGDRRENEKQPFNSDCSNDGDVTNTTSTRQPSEEHREIESGWIAKESFRDDWTNFPTQSPVCDGNDGFPTESLRQFFREDSNGVISEKEIDKIIYQAYGRWRNETIKAGGNAIVPQVAYQIFKAIEQTELQKT